MARGPRPDSYVQFLLSNTQFTLTTCVLPPHLYIMFKCPSNLKILESLIHKLKAPFCSILDKHANEKSILVS